MKSRIGAVTALVFALGCSSAQAAPTTVDVRVEGATRTLFEGQVTTDGKLIEQDKSGPQKCDGTNAGANPTPGPTVTSALDNAVAWDGTWNDQFSDFLVNRIGTDAGSANAFWTSVLNGQPTTAGGCQVQVKAGDDVLWAYVSQTTNEFLALSGPTKVRRGKRFRVKVVDTKTGNAVRGARVGPARTNANGVAKLRAVKRGRVTLKARKAGTVRSNAIRIRVR
jgi:hypothetical protein